MSTLLHGPNVLGGVVEMGVARTARFPTERSLEFSAGIDHVGIGSDYDGVGDTLPIGLKDVSDYPNLIYVLLKRGYSDADIEKICSKNVFRVWNQVIDVADKAVQ